MVLNSSQQCALAAKTISFLCCISCFRHSVTSRSGEGSFPSGSMAETHLQCGIQLWAPQHTRDKD